MTNEEKRINYCEWKRKRDFRKKLTKCYPDLGELAEMRHGIAEMIISVTNEINHLKDEVYEEDDELCTLKCDKALLIKVFNHLNKDAKELFERYGVEDKCAES